MPQFPFSLIVLGGNSIRNQKWAHDWANTLSPNFANSFTHNYRHWIQPEDFQSIDLDHEANQLKNIPTEFKNGVVFAKSAGTLLTSKLIYSNVFNPQACVFLGIPYSWGSKNWPVDLWLKSIKCPVMVIQHTNDPVMSFKDMQEMHDRLELNWKLKEIPGNNHEYTEMDEIKQLVIEFLSSLK